MRVFREEAAIRAAAASSQDAGLADLITRRVHELAEYDCDLAELVNIFVIEAGDALPQIDAALGFGLTEHPIDIIEVHDLWYELTVVIRDDGFGLVIYVPVNQAVDADLLAFCKGLAAAKER